MIRALPFLALAALAGCSDTPQRVLFATTPSLAQERVSVSTVLIRDVSLPAYAEDAQIMVQSEDGFLEEVDGLIWADTPARAMAHALVRQLTTISNAKAAVEPWPLAEEPQAEVSVRVDSIVVMQPGTLQLKGHYGIRYDNFDRRGKLELFDLAVPVTSIAVADLPPAYDLAWKLLAEQIAGDI